MRKRSRGNIFIVSAPSGAGKTTLCNSIIEKLDNLRQSVSFTTRKPRKGETNDTDYTFVSEEEFKRMVDTGEFIEWAVVHGNLYGTSRKRLEEIMDSGADVLLDIDTQGARQIRDIYESGVFIFILPPSLEVLRSRLQSRNSNTEEEIETRLRRAIDEIRDYALYEYVIVNDILEDSVEKLRAVILADRQRSRRLDAALIRENFLV